MKPLSLAHLTVLDVGPPDLIELAASAGFRAISIRLCSPVHGGIEYPLLARSSELRSTKRLLHELDVKVTDIEVITLAANTSIGDYESTFEAGAELGAHRACVNIDDTDRARVIDRFSALCDLAAPFGLSLDVEFMLWRPVARLADAVNIVRSSGKPNAFVLIDALHLIRSGGTVEEVAALDPQIIGSVQLCDAPMASPADIVAEARGDRLLPGEGELPLRALLAVLPDNLPLAVEVPLKRETNPLKRAILVQHACQSLLETSARVAR
ncbi:TIM barrel protein [Caballeronia sp. LP006]|uniref:sugar phosphate isomerase/epimerase family protein n=1 Tax=Caballeronia sp. LP006 TaxID=3038552 RepID=UPI00285F6A24|nr:TIM barrel protein [Caballeronia sp. LP006]MDR5827150.1 TIM barrel protein [Caballeronia sp. LP006]